MHVEQQFKTGIAGLTAVLFCALAKAADTPDTLAALESMNLEDLGDIKVNYVVAASKYTDSGSTTIPGPDVSGYPTVNFTLFSQNIVKNLEVSASVYNLLDQSYTDPATAGHLQSQIPQDGRTFLIKAARRF